MQTREESLNYWLENYFEKTPYTLSALSGDASFRRYFRVHHHNKTYIVMDAPPEKESLSSFLSVRTLLSQASLCVPQCFAEDLDHGFLLLSDFGDCLFLSGLTEENANSSYEAAIKILVQLQTIHPQTSHLPLFDEAHILNELAIFENYFLKTYLQRAITPAETDLLKTTFFFLAQEITAQPQVVIHRDYHSRNIMRLPQNQLKTYQLGIIDFQDAMVGPWTYDLVSLLKDCYIEWPKAQRDTWLHHFYALSPLNQEFSKEDCMHFFNICGLQRHLKVLGIFARLALRDQKKQYLKDIPLTLKYVQETLPDLRELSDFSEWMLKVKLP